MKRILSWITIILPGIMIPIIPGMIEAQPYQALEETNHIQQYIKPEEVMLEFSMTDSTVTVIAITRDSMMIACQSLNSLFWKANKAFRSKIKAGDPLGFVIVGQILYFFLIRPVQHFISGKKRLIIKPGDSLSELPFEVLIQPDDNNSLLSGVPINYLIRDYEVTYHADQSVLPDVTGEIKENLPENTMDQQYAFMGFSPVFVNHPGLSALPDSREEIREIGSLFRKKGLTSWLVYEQHSDKERFKSTACMGRIVHLSTHYLSEPPEIGNGGFLFSGYDPSISTEGETDGVLTIDEISGLQLNADLVVLNACASGIQKLKSGGSRNSMPMVFLKAGARNILSTLWSVTDRLAGEFMINFYRIWLSGKTYSQALREVKLELISHPETSLPKIWAPYVLTARRTK